MKPLRLKLTTPESLFFLAIAALLFLSWSGILDKLSNDFIDSSIVQATIAFGSARGLNAVISTFQSTTLTVQMLGGVAVGVGEILDPINDLVEQYSSLMQLSIGSLVIQKVLLEIVSHGFFKILITVSGVGLLASLLINRGDYANFMAKSLFFLIFLRFSLALVVLLNAVVSEIFIDEKTEQDVRRLQGLSGELESAQEVARVSPEVREALEGDLESAKASALNIEAQIGLVTSEVADLAQEVLESDRRLSEIQSEVGVLDRFNFLNRPEELKSAEELFEEKEDELDVATSKLKNLQDSLTSTGASITTIENTLAGRPNSIFESMGQSVSNMTSGVASMGSSMNIANTKDKMEGAVSSLINVMTLFLMKTLLLPLLFLYLLSKSLKMVWGVEFKELLPKKEAYVH